MLFNFSDNNMNLVFQTTEEGYLILKDFYMSGYIAEPKEDLRWSNIVDVHLSGENQNDHHGAKHTGSSENLSLKYISHKCYENDNGKKLEFLLENKKILVTVHYQFYKNISVVRSWSVVKNISDEPVGLEYLSSFTFTGLPYLMGERTPHLDPNARGSFIGLSAIHERGDMIRAIMEGVTYSLKDCLSVLEEMGVRPDNMLACGGGARSDLWKQMMADVYDMNISTVDSKEGPALGVAILAMVGAGLYDSVEEACQKVIRVNHTTKKSAENAEKYKNVYHIYKGLYQHLKEDYSELIKI